MFLPHFDALLWSITDSDARQHGIYSFYIITKSLLYFKIFQNNAKAGLLPRLCPAFAWKKAIDVIYDRFKMKQFHWLLCVAKNRSSLNENLQRKQNWTAKSTNLEENAGKIKSVFAIRAALWVEKLGHCPENYRSWKNTPGKLVVTVNLEAIWSEVWRKGA